MVNDNLKAAIWGAVGLLTVASVISILLARYQVSLINQNANQNSSWDNNSSFPSFPDFQPVVKSGSIILYRNFVMTAPIIPENIVKYSYRVQAKGKIASGRLIVKASTTSNGYDQTRIHSVYFYIDDGRSGGHIDATRNSNGQIVTGGFTIKESPYNKTLDLASVPVSGLPNETMPLRVLNTLNDNKPHFIGAFVSTGIFGSLDLLQIEYTCEPNTDCSIDLIQ